MSDAWADPDLRALLIGVAAAIALGAALTQFLPASETREKLATRTGGWASMFVLFLLVLVTGTPGAAVLFAFVSLLALREFVTLSSTARSDHKALIWAFFVLTPLQYLLVARGDYQLFSVLIPMAGFIVISARNASVGDVDRFLERTASIQWALLACVYCISFVPAILTLEIAGYGPQAKLLLYFVIVVQTGDLAESLLGRIAGRRALSPLLRTRRSWEGLVGGVAVSTLVGTALWWATPFDALDAAALSFTAGVLGSLGGLVMSAIKRDRDRDARGLIRLRGGVLYGVDALVFSAPIFYFLVRSLYT